MKTNESSEETSPEISEEFLLGKLAIEGAKAFARSEDVRPGWDSRDTRFRAGYVQEWLKNTRPSAHPLEAEQMSAIGAELEKDILVSAGAGSGKSTSLVYRALFLIEKMAIAPEKILMLVFNAKARNNLIDKVKKAFASSTADQVPNIENFHQIGYAFCNKMGIRIIDEDVQQVLALDFIAEILGETSDGRLVNLKELIKWFAEQDEEQIRGADRKSIWIPMDCRGKEIVVKSHGESLIAEFLNHINSNFPDFHPLIWEYEKEFTWDGEPYRPDFTVLPEGRSGKGLVIEYFGMVGDKFYNAQIEEKRKYWKAQPGWKLLELYPWHIHSGQFQTKILEALASLKLIPHDLAVPRFYPANHGVEYLPDLAKKLLKFVHLCRVNKRNPDTASESRIGSLLHRIGNPPDSEVEEDPIDAAVPHDVDDLKREAFHEIGHEFYRRYLKYLKETGQEDFDGSLIHAENILRNPGRNFPRNLQFYKHLQYILIDEFQDYSLLYHDLVEAIRLHQNDCRLFCVGDDWQAINGFTGADTRFFDAMRNAPATKVRNYELRINHRCGAAIVEAANRMMAPASPSAWRKASRPGGEVHLLDILGFVPTASEERASTCPYIHAVARIVRAYPDEEIAALSRNHLLPRCPRKVCRVCANNMAVDEFQGTIRRLTGKSITVSTVHKVKGLEFGVVIILDVMKGRYPLHHPDSVLFETFGETRSQTIYEHRCLLYVAMTRAKKKLFLITDAKKQSDFLPLDDDFWKEKHNNPCDLFKICKYSVYFRESLKGRDLAFQKVIATLKDKGFTYDKDNQIWSKQIASNSSTKPEEGLEEIQKYIMVIKD